jgi:hypothetical protein|tara:strand:- start:426 stop:599 length:174 start_codon:yes stop_codon:yes gene_type:complete
MREAAAALEGTSQQLVTVLVVLVVAVTHGIKMIPVRTARPTLVAAQAELDSLYLAAK